MPKVSCSFIPLKGKESFCSFCTNWYSYYNLSVSKTKIDTGIKSAICVCKFIIFIINIFNIKGYS